MKGVDWGGLYDKFHTKVLDKVALDMEIAKLIIDSDVQTKKAFVRMYSHVMSTNSVYGRFLMT